MGSTRIAALLAALALALAGCSDDDSGGQVGEGGAHDVSEGAGEAGDAGSEGTPDTGAGEGSTDPDASPAPDAQPSEEGGAPEDTSEGGPGDLDSGGEGRADVVMPDPDVAVPDTADPDVVPDPDIAPEPDAPEPDIEEDVVDEPGTGYPAMELSIRITSPGAGGVAQAMGTNAQVAGVLFGHADLITWEHLGTGASGEIDVKTFWVSFEPIALQPGDNPVRVTAVDSESGAVAVDTVVITHNPAFLWDTIPWATPSVVLVGNSTPVVFRAQMGQTSNFNPNTVQIWSVDADGNPIAKVSDLRDNGQVNAFCDEVDKDGIFSGCGTVNPSTPGLLRYRVRADVTNVFTTYQAWSPVFYIEAVQAVTVAECNATKGVLGAAKASYLELIETMSAEEAQATVIADLLEDPLVAEAGPATDGYGVWVAFESGVLGALQLNPDGIRGAGGPGSGLETSAHASGAPPLDIISRAASVLAPFQTHFEQLDESLAIRNTLIDVGCPAFDVTYRANEQADLYSFRRSFRAGVISLVTHGDALFYGLSLERRAGLDWRDTPSQELMWMGEPVDCSKLMQSNPTGCSPGGASCANGAGECVLGKTNQCVDTKHADLRRGRLVMGDTHYAITPEYVTFHAARRPLPRSLVYLGACRSLFNGGFAGAFFGRGARAVAGFSDFVTSAFANKHGMSLFDAMVNEGLQAGAALQLEEEVEDPANPGSFFRLFGATNLSVSNSTLLNPSFETGDATGWITEGDGRVIGSLGATIPVHGKYMGLVSTGLGFTQTTGELRQKFCIDADKTQISFWYKFYSEEFMTFCGSIFQDAFTATLGGSQGTLTMVDVTIDALCPSTQCSTPLCASQYVGLVPSDVAFDVGGVYNTPWLLRENGITMLAGQGPVTLSFFTTDVGDSIYDTAILIDNILLK